MSYVPLRRPGGSKPRRNDTESWTRSTDGWWTRSEPRTRKLSLIGLSCLLLSYWPSCRFGIEEIIDPADTRAILAEWVKHVYEVLLPQRILERAAGKVNPVFYWCTRLSVEYGPRGWSQDVRRRWTLTLPQFVDHGLTSISIESRYLNAGRCNLVTYCDAIHSKVQWSRTMTEGSTWHCVHRAFPFRKSWQSARTVMISGSRACRVPEKGSYSSQLSGFTTSVTHPNF